MRWITLLITMALPSAFAAHYNPPHTDGIEPYYHPKALKRYLAELTPEEQAPLFAKKGAIDWWTDARFGAFICWGPSSMLECSLGWGCNGPRPGHSTDGKFGSASRVEQFVIEAKTSKGGKTIHEGTTLGGDFGLVLPAPVTSDSFRIRVIKCSNVVSINSIELFKGE